jgi:predicted XRE-type DNA-binding protein
VLVKALGKGGVDLGMPNAKNLGAVSMSFAERRYESSTASEAAASCSWRASSRSEDGYPGRRAETGPTPHGKRRVKGNTMTNKKRSSRRNPRTAGGVIERLDALATKANAAAQRRVDEMLAKILIRNDLIRLREKRGVTQKQLASLMGVSQPLIAQLESTAPRNIELRTLVRAAVALGAEVKVELREAPKSRKRAA